MYTSSVTIESFFNKEKLMDITKLFDFDQPNLQDIEINNTLNQHVALSVGHKIGPNTRIKLSNMYMTLEQFEKLLPTSALPAFIRAGAVELTPIFSSVSVKVEKETVASVVVEESNEPPVAGTVLSQIVVEDGNENPFGSETNEGLITKGAPITTTTKKVVTPVPQPQPQQINKNNTIKK